jgi:hypothetical protein
MTPDQIQSILSSAEAEITRLATREGQYYRPSEFATPGMAEAIRDLCIENQRDKLTIADLQKSYSELDERAKKTRELNRRIVMNSERTERELTDRIAFLQRRIDALSKKDGK